MVCMVTPDELVKHLLSLGIRTELCISGLFLEG